MGVLIKALKKLRQLDHPIVRDFTEAAEEKMVKIAKEVLEDDYDLFSKYVTDPFGRWLDSMGYLEVLVGVDNYQKSVIDCYNYSAQNIEKICRQMRGYDGRYGQRVANYAHQADNVCRLTKALAECLDVNSADYTSEHPISDRIMWFRTHWVKGMDGERVQISELESDAERRCRDEYNHINITEDEIVDFCFDSDSMTIFEEYTDYIFDSEMDWGALDIIFLSTGTVIYKGVEMTIDELLSVLTKEGYSEKIVREELNKIISSVISADSTAQSFVKDHDAAKEAVESLISDYMKDKDKNSAFKSFVEAMGGVEAVKQLAKTCPEVLDYLFSDYSKGLEIIEDIAQTCQQSGSAEMRAAVERLRQEYDSKWKGLLHKTKDFSVDMISNLTKEGIEEWIKDEIGDTSVLLKVLEIADLQDKVDGSHKLIALKKLAYQLQDAYEDAIEKIKSGNYTQEDLDYAQNMFNMLKETTKSVYETYRDMCDDPSKQIWCNDQIEKIDRIGMHGFNGPYGFEL